MCGPGERAWPQAARTVRACSGEGYPHSATGPRPLAPRGYARLSGFPAPRSP